jgi:hypothetical protein
MQKVVNVLAVASSVVSLAVVGFGGYVFINKDSIIEGVKQQAMDAVLGGMGGGALPGAGLGVNDLAPSAPQTQVPGGVQTSAADF